MAEVNCKCCAKSPETWAILERASTNPSNPSFSGRVLSAAAHGSVPRHGVRGVGSGYTAANFKGKQAPCVWVTQGEAIKRLALFPVSLLGEGFLEPIRAGFRAYEELALKLGMKLRSIPSP